jgi:ABC-type multidrug transport system fused ATPase/permease subunit
MAPAERRRFSMVMVLLFFGSLLELAGVGIIFPYLHIVSDPAAVLAHPTFGQWFRAVGATEPKQVVVMVSFATLGFFILKAVGLGVLMRYSMRRFQQLGHSLSERLMRAYMEADWSFHTSRNQADLVRNVTIECEQYSGAIKFLAILPTEIVLVTGILGLLLMTQATAALAAGATIGLLAWGLSRLTRKRLHRASLQRAGSQGRMIQWVNQGLGSLREARILGREEFFVRSFSRQGEVYRDALMEAGFFGQLPRLVIESAAGLCLVSIVFAALSMGTDLPSLMPALSLLAIALVRIVPSSTRILTSLTSLRFAGPTLGSLLTEYEDAKRAADDVNAGSDGELSFRKTLELKGVTRFFNGAGTAAVSDVSLVIQQGQMVALSGASGAGKSTLANLILGLLPPTSGLILADGRDIRQNLTAWRGKIGYIPQEIYLLDDTLRRNVALGIPDSEIDDAKVWRALESAQLAKFVRSQPEGLDLSAGERGSRLSAGQRQRTGIARALYRDPDLLVLDEATSALDNETERLFTEVIEGLRGTKTLIIIAHRMATVRRADVICVMEGGRIIDTGTYDQLLAHNPRFRELTGSSRAPRSADLILHESLH